ncbi:general stress protein [Bacillus altitudinis MN12]|uniref:RNA polymerase-binding transcription factor DksA n=1 Tax=Bacillus aerius TaxID=293388 RepID=A0AB39J0J0_9BACI|nr:MULTISPECIES: TraR/DksA C4-type zinc finger protein [Bacillus]AHL71730.1 general stress protein [Bacillus pumilus]MBA8919169.1 RNA polymerase-binding transcription factor DksA [Bacillus aerius]MBR0583238.1 general stress protein [Bacillus altitudinis MN12]MBR0592586.1 general stress protein [Bacillus altitudinis C16B11]MBR0628756.1 general stress protein [Bacillus altitudinis S70-5-12]MBW3702205.1 general stress protein [Bacillus aerophilus]MCA1017602.1 TraR/DksA C4-type zinc finger prote
MSLTKEQKADLYERLIQLKEDVKGSKKKEESMLVESNEISNGVGNHIADHGSIYLDRMTEQTLDQVDDQLEGEIDAALKRMEDGTYGICEKTGKDIPYERLKAVPYTRYSIDAKKNEETNQDPNEFDRSFSEQMRDLTNRETMDQLHSDTYERLEEEQDVDVDEEK